MSLRVPRLALALALVAASALVAWVVSATGAHSASPPEPLAGVAHSQAEATQRALVMLDRAFVLGAVRVAGPASFPTAAPQDYRVQRRRWLMVAGSYATVLQSLRDHSPTGFSAGPSTLMPTAAFSIDGGGVTEYRLTGRENSSLHVLDVTANNLGHDRVSLRIDATVGWVPARTVAEAVPTGEADASLTRRSGETLGLEAARTLSPLQLQTLATTINALPTTVPDEYNACPTVSYTSALLTLPAQGSRPAYRIELTGCNEVHITVGGVAQPVLASDDQLDEQLTTLFAQEPPAHFRPPEFRRVAPTP
ncbi:hypothetical protein acdb102_19000 [Acidothermaceae bacterium B102]|nr:hypothetical protein acdb102_19000 [Acidothermaceae bacterium B102]